MLGRATVSLLAGLTSVLATAEPAHAATAGTAHAEEHAEQGYRPMWLAGAGLGLTSSLGYVAEGHAGFGVHRKHVRLLGVLEYAHSHLQPFLTEMAVTRRQLALSGLVVFSPFEGDVFHVHASLGLGPAWDTFVSPTVTVTDQRWTVVGSAGIGWKGVSLRLRSVSPRATRDGAPPAIARAEGLQVLLGASLGLDL